MLVRSITSAFEILHYLAANPSQGVTSIARAVEMSPSSCFNILRTLAHEGLISFNPQTKKYAVEPLPADYFAVAPQMNELLQWLHQQDRKSPRLNSSH